MSMKHDLAATGGGLGYPSKMPGTSYGIPASACITGAKLHKVPDSVCHGCYALKGNYLYPSVETAQKRRLDALQNPHWVRAMVNLINHAQQTGKGRNGPIARGFHRWHDSGDIQSVDHLEKICAVARATPSVKHWLPTRELNMVRDHEKQFGKAPRNLVIRVSATMVDGPATRAWPTTSGVHDKTTPRKSQICPAPRQEGKCGDCRKCWNPKVAHVSYHKH